MIDCWVACGVRQAGGAYQGRSMKKLPRVVVEPGQGIPPQLRAQLRWACTVQNLGGSIAFLRAGPPSPPRNWGGLGKHSAPAMGSAVRPRLKLA